MLISPGAPNLGAGLQTLPDLLTNLNPSEQGLVEVLLGSLTGLVAICKENTCLDGCVCGLLADVFNTLSKSWDTTLVDHTPLKPGLKFFDHSE